MPLAANRQERALAVGAEAPSLLAGLIVDADGNPMTPTHATKKAKRYRYYVSTSLLAGDHPQAQKGMRVPAGDIEALVLDRLRAFFSSRTDIGDGYKIANPTVLARITREELEQLFRGYGWTPYFVEGHEPELMHEAMAATLDTAVEQIQKIQQDARTHGNIARPRWPMIV